MNFKETILKRRSIRKYLDTEISETMITDLIEAGYNAPSACNRKPINFYVITNKEIIKKLDKSGRFTNMHSPLIIIVAGDLKRALPFKYKDYWIQDASAATENILLMATSLGLGACWNGVYPQMKVVENIQQILGLDDKIIPLSLIHIGYPKEEKEPNKGFDSKHVFYINKE